MIEKREKVSKVIDIALTTLIVTARILTRVLDIYPKDPRSLDIMTLSYGGVLLISTREAILINYLSYSE